MSRATASTSSDPDLGRVAVESRGTPGTGRSAPSRRHRAVVGLVVLALLVVPLFASSGFTVTLTRILALALLAVSLDLLVGVGGMPSLGHAAPFGVGAYAAGRTATDLTQWAPAQLLVAATAGAVLSVLIGWLVVRARGTYFLMLSLAFAEIVHVLAVQWDDLTGGDNGLVGIPAITLVPGGEPVTLAGVRYWYVLAVALLCFTAIMVVSRSAFGRSLRGIRDNQERMSSLGYSTFQVKYKAFVIAGAAAGAAGSLWVVQARFVSPSDLAFELSALALLAVVIGGRGSVWGAVLGAGVVYYIRDEIGADWDGRGPLLLGLVFIAAVFLLPRGFAGLRVPGGVAGRIRRRRTQP